VSVVAIVLVVGLARRIGILEAAIRQHGVGRDSATNEIRQQWLGSQLADQARRSGVAHGSGDMAGILLFVSEHCGPCQSLAGDIERRVSQGPAGLAELLGARVTIISDEPRAFADLGASAVIIDSDETVRREFRVAATPTGMVLDEYGVVIDAMIVNTYGDVQHLADSARQERGASSLASVSQ